MTDILHSLKDYGIGYVLFAVIVFSIWKFGWPLVADHIKWVQTFTEGQLKAAAERQEKSQAEFLAALDRRDRQFDALAEQFQRVSDRIIDRIDNLSSNGGHHGK